MILEFLKMDGFGAFIWMSYGIVFVTCIIIYLKTLKTLKKYEQEYKNELLSLDKKERQRIIKKSKVANQVFTSVKESI
jgi:heme exporter protein D